jgi:RimJ/RimL family protein N-acetyltransferase
VSLRDVRGEDLPVFFEHQLDPDASRMAAFPPRDRVEFMAHWRRSLADATAILETVDWRGEVAGNVVYWEEHGEPKVGFWLGKEYWGRGIASAALSLFLGLVSVRPLYARVAKHNLASRRVLEKCGFTIAGEDSFTAAGEIETEEFIMLLSDRRNAGG